MTYCFVMVLVIVILLFDSDFDLISYATCFINVLCQKLNVNFMVPIHEKTTIDF